MAPLVTAHDAQHRRQPEPAPRKLGRKERIENFGLSRRTHAAAVVAHFHEHVFAVGQLGGQKRVPQVLTLGVDHAAGHADHARALASASAALTTKFISTCRICVASASTGGSSSARSRRRVAPCRSRAARAARLTSQLAHVQRTHHEATLARIGEQLPTQDPLRGWWTASIWSTCSMSALAAGSSRRNQADVAQNPCQ